MPVDPHHVVEIASGEWTPPADAQLLIVQDGLLARDVEVGAITSTELLVPGDLALVEADADSQVPQRVTWSALGRARLTLVALDAARQLDRWPAMAERIALSGAAQLRRQSELLAIGHLPRVHDRVLALLWHLAPMVGRMTPDGIVLPLDLTHERMGRLVGGRRPTVSLALRRLGDAGVLTRGADGGWLLAPDSADAIGHDLAGALVAG